MIRQANSHDIHEIVNIHVLSFPGFFLTFLGKAFLREFYRATLDSPSGLCFVADFDGKLCGFVAGTTHPVGFFRQLLRKRWFWFAQAALPSVIKRPTIIPRLLRAFLISGQVTQEAGRGTLLSIGVLPAKQGQGVGHVLVRAFLREAVHRELRYVDLTTDKDGNEAANRFYQKLGFVCERTFTTPEGRTMNEYVISLSSQQCFSFAGEEYLSAS